MKVILASQSPRRKQLMDQLNIPYEIIVSGIDETLKEGLTLEEQSKELAYRKGKAVYDRTKDRKDRIIISSDTMCLKDGILYGKPKTEQQAIQNFREFSGKQQQVINSLCILVEKNGKLEKYDDYNVSTITFAKMDEQDIQICLRNENVYDKAGGFHILGFSGIYLDKIEGNITGVLGLPMNIVYQVLKKYQVFN